MNLPVNLFAAFLLAVIIGGIIAGLIGFIFSIALMNEAADFAKTEFQNSILTCSEDYLENALAIKFNSQFLYCTIEKKEKGSSDLNFG